MGENPDHNSQSFRGVRGRRTRFRPIRRRGRPDRPAGRSRARSGRAAEARPRTKPPSSRTPGCAPRPRPTTSASRRQNDVAKAHKYAIERFAEELLAVKDALERRSPTPTASIEALRDGVELTLKNLNAAFDKAQIAEINPAAARSSTRTATRR